MPVSKLLLQTILLLYDAETEAQGINHASALHAGSSLGSTDRGHLRSLDYWKTVDEYMHLSCSPCTASLIAFPQRHQHQRQGLPSYLYRNPLFPTYTNLLGPP